MAIALVGTATTAASLTITAPAGVGPGHVLVAAAANSTATAFTWPSPWVVWRGINNFSQDRMEVATLAWTTGSSWNLTGGGGGWIANVCAAYSGVDLATIFAAENIGTDGGSNGTTNTTPAITNPAGHWLVGCFANTGSACSAYTLSAVERAETVAGGSIGISLADTNGAGPSGSQSMSATIGNFLSSKIGWLGALKPAATANPGQFFALL